MRCSNCGASDQVDVCAYCGSPLIDEATEYNAAGAAGGYDASQAPEKETVVERVYVVDYRADMSGVSPKSRLVTTLLCFFLGVFGIHRFYLGKVLSGILMLITFGGLGIWYFIDLILAICGKMRDGQGRLVSDWQV